MFIFKKRDDTGIHISMEGFPVELPRIRADFWRSQKSAGCQKRETDSTRNRMELNPGTKRFANQLSICGIRHVDIAVGAPKLNWHTHIVKPMRNQCEAQAWCCHDRRLNSQIRQKSIPYRRRIGVQVRRINETQRIANELGRLAAMFRYAAQIWLGADGGQNREPARRETKSTDPFRVDLVMTLLILKHIVDGGV